MKGRRKPSIDQFFQLQAFLRKAARRRLIASQSVSVLPYGSRIQVYRLCPRPQTYVRLFPAKQRHVADPIVLEHKSLHPGDLFRRIWTRALLAAKARKLADRLIWVF